MAPVAVNIAEKFASFTDQWSPKVAAELNGQQVKLVRFEGEFVWHHHDHEDEMFLVVSGSFDMEFRDRTVPVREGDRVPPPAREGDRVPVPVPVREECRVRVPVRGRPRARVQAQE